MRRTFIAAALVACALTGACKSASSTADSVASAGQSLADGASKAAVSLVNVDLSNVLNDLALQLHVDRSNIPVNAQIPITLAANVCGVSINILSVGAAGGNSAGCNATTSSPELAQVVQQQMAANGNVGGGSQGTTPPATTTTTTTAPPATSTNPPTDSSTPPQ
jgi:hypothetical protein